MRVSLGVMGGTFDPIHVGHLRTALELREYAQWREVRLIPCGVPPHREPPRASVHDRLAMVTMAVRNTPGLTVDDRETRLAGPSYTVDTLASLRQEWPQASLALIVGADQFIQLATWHRWQEIFSLSHLVVVQRPGRKIEVTDRALRDRTAAAEVGQIRDLENAPAGNVFFWCGTQIAVSATQIREAVRCGRSIQYLVPECVREYILRHGLYRD